jgi:hypothetical protein
MVVAGVLIETTPGAAPLVAGRLALAPGVTLQGGDGTRRIAAVLEAVDGAALEALTERLLRDDERILGVFPTFVGDADEPA